MNESLIVVRQLPIIEERLKTISEDVDKRVQEALSLVCTEDTVKAVKAIRAALTKDFKELEAQRKAVKTAVLAPYQSFEAVYKELVSGKFESADAALKKKVDDVENDLKHKKETELRTYYTEYCQACGIDFIPLEQTGIRVTLSASLKSLKEAAKSFIDRTVSDIAMIATQEDADEIMVEYKKTLDPSLSVCMVKERHESARREAERREQRAARENAVEAVVEQVDELLPPDVVQADPEPEAEEDPIMELTFTVTNRRSKLIALKKFLTEGSYNFE